MAAPQSNQPVNVPDNLDRVTRHSKPVGVPPSLNENVFSIDEDHAGDSLVALARQALKGGRIAAERALQIQQAVREDATLTSAAAALKIRDATFAATRGPLASLQDCIEKFDTRLSKLREHLQGPPGPRNATEQLAINHARTALAAMAAAERRKVILAGIAVGDMVTMQAATRAPHYTIGCTAEEAQQFALAWAAKHAPQEAASHAVLSAVAEHVQRGGRLLLEFSTSLSSSDLAATAQRSHARAEAAILAANAA